MRWSDAIAGLRWLLRAPACWALRMDSCKEPGLLASSKQFGRSSRSGVGGGALVRRIEALGFHSDSFSIRMALMLKSSPQRPTPEQLLEQIEQEERRTQRGR